MRSTLQKRKSRLTDFTTFLENDHPDLTTLFLLELLEPDGCTQASRTTANDDHVDFVRGSFDICWIEQLSPTACSRVQ